MKFYDRKEELNYLKKIHRFSKKRAQLTVITGRRRVGKTELIKEFLKTKKTFSKEAFYFFISRKRTRIILDEFSGILSKKIPIVSTSFKDWDQFFHFIFEFSINQNLTIILDEFQNFKYIDPSVFSVLQGYLDKYKEKSKLNLIVIGSIFTLMEDIFFNAKEPLFQRADHKIELKPFLAETVGKILKDNHSKNNLKELIKFYTVFGGIPKYYSDIANHQSFKKNFFDILKELILNSNALLKKEGFDLIGSEFSKNYQTYFSIIQAVAYGKNKTGEIADITGVPVPTLSQYLEQLVFYFKIFQRKSPVLDKKKKNFRYMVDDHFLTFWFRYLYKNWSMIEMEDFFGIFKFIKKDLPILFGFTLEKIVKEMILTKKIKNFPLKNLNELGNWWSGRREIDLIGIDRENKEIFFGECKLNPKKVTIKTGLDLIEKAKLVKWYQRKRKEHYGIFTLGKVNSKTKRELHKNKVMVYSLSNPLH
jgi:hypothetical protein